MASLKLQWYPKSFWKSKKCTRRPGEPTLPKFRNECPRQTKEQCKYWGMGCPGCSRRSKGASQQTRKASDCTTGCGQTDRWGHSLVGLWRRNGTLLCWVKQRAKDRVWLSLWWAYLKCWASLDPREARVGQRMVPWARMEAGKVVGSGVILGELTVISWWIWYEAWRKYGANDGPEVFSQSIWKPFTEWVRGKFWGEDQEFGLEHVNLI